MSDISYIIHVKTQSERVFSNAAHAEDRTLCVSGGCLPGITRHICLSSVLCAIWGLLEHVLSSADYLKPYVRLMWHGLPPSRQVSFTFWLCMVPGNVTLLFRSVWCIEEEIFAHNDVWHRREVCPASTVHAFHCLSYCIKLQQFCLSFLH